MGILRVSALVLAVAACGGVGDTGDQAQQPAPPTSASSPPPPPPLAATVDSKEAFQDLNGVTWLYTTSSKLRFADIQSQLDSYKARGIRILGIYSPYNGNTDKWLGCAPLDYYATAPQSGTIDDFRSLVLAAHARGMKIVTYFVSIYIDHESSFFKKAEEQYKAGDRTSAEVAAFHWSDSASAAPLPTPSAGPGCSDPDLDPEDKGVCTQWRFSQTANAYYWSLWGEAGFDFNLPGARAEVERAMKFWLDTGVDGFMFDAAFADPAFKAAMADLPKQYTKTDKWITFESAAGEDDQKLDAFGLTSWFNTSDDDEGNDYSYVAHGSDTADNLEASLKRVDFAREHGKTTFAWSVLETKYPNELAMRAQEAALLAGAGMLYGLPNESDTFATWSAETQAAWSNVMVTINANKALLPSASRKRVAVTGSAKSYAMTRTSKDGTQSALLVYNFTNAEATLTLDLTSIKAGTTVRDLMSSRVIPQITTPGSYALTLPAYGFEILELTQ